MRKVGLFFFNSGTDWIEFSNKSTFILSSSVYKPCLPKFNREWFVFKHKGFEEDDS